MSDSYMALVVLGFAVIAVLAFAAGRSWGRFSAIFAVEMTGIFEDKESRIVGRVEKKTFGTPERSSRDE